MLTLLKKSSTLSKFSQNIFSNLPYNPKPLNRQLAETSDSKSCTQHGKSEAPVKTFNTPHPSKDPPDNFVPSVIHKAFPGPEFLPYTIFRPFETPEEKLGPGAHKCGQYKNPEYYAYHRYTFSEVQRNTIELRQQSILNGGARCIYDYESGGEGGEGDPRPKKGKKRSGSSGSGSDDDDTRDRRNCINPIHYDKKKGKKKKKKNKKRDRNDDDCGKGRDCIDPRTGK